MEDQDHKLLIQPLMKMKLSLCIKEAKRHLQSSVPLKICIKVKLKVIKKKKITIVKVLPIYGEKVKIQIVSIVLTVIFLFN